MKPTRPALPALADDLSQASELVGRAVRAAVRPNQMVERRMRPESTLSWEEPAPLAGLGAALAVARMAEQRAYDYAVKLRAIGISWAEVADLLGLPYDDGYSRAERAYELILGPDPDEGRRSWHNRNLYWDCGGPLGCGRSITDRGPYEAWPSDNQAGHDPDCRRLQAEEDAHRRDSEERDRLASVMNDAYEALTWPEHRAIVDRCRWTLRHGGQINGGWATGEQLVVALVLGDEDFLRRANHTRAEVVTREFGGQEGVPALLAKLRLAATGASR